MAESTRTNSTWRYVHGNGAANSSSIPCIIVNFDVVCTRESGSQEVKWEIQNMDWDHWNASNYGYYIKIYVAVNPVDPYNPDYDTELSTILKKDTLTGSNWWNYVTLHNPSWDYQKFNSTSTTGTCYIYAEVTDCCRYANNTIPCYYTNAGGHFCLFDSFTVDLPTYETKYAVTYNGNGGSPVPGDQEKSSLGPMQISPIRPYKYVTINYYNNPTQSDSASIDFNGWLCSADSQIYQPNGSYGINQACTMTAQWGSAHFTPPAMPSATYTLTFNYMGGAGSPASTPLQRAKLGYNTNSAATTADYAPGTSYTTATDLNLYPIFGSATVVYNSLPQTTKDGYAFRGWFKDSACTQKITSNYTINSNTTIYAGWTPLPVHKRLPNGTWNNIGPTVYKRLSNGTWSNEAHVYKYINGEWVDLSQ